jgi:HAMP domain-containing protein/type II secretory pathway pseudopilin PulG
VEDVRLRRGTGSGQATREGGDMGLRLKFNLMVGAILLLGFLAAAVVIWKVAEQNAQDDLRRQIEVLRGQALAVRQYTSEEVGPLLVDKSNIQFISQSVPSFAAHATFRNFQKNFPAFDYKEAATNPTNPDDLASDWEREIIEELRREGSEEIVRVRSMPQGDRFVVAFLLKVNSESCLACHSTPEKAPPSMVALYGDKNGFGWKLNDVIGAQFISVPIEVVQDRAWQNLQLFAVTLGMIFLVLMILLNVLLGRLVITPVSRMARLAEAVSMGDNTADEFVLSGKDEIASLTQSFNRMRRSLDNAMKMLES